MALRHPVLMSCVQFDQALKSGESPVTDLASIARRLGVDGVEYREVYWQDKERELPAVRDQIAASDLRVTYCTFTPIFNADPEARARLLQDIDDAAALGSPLLRVFIGIRDMPASPAEGQEVWEGARAAVERARERGVRLALENHINVLGPRWTQVHAVVTALSSPALGVNIDTSNYVQNGEPLMTAIEELRPWIAYSHLKDVRREGDSYAVVPLGEGELDFAAILDAYAVAGAPFPLCFEFPGGADPEAAITSSLDHLARLGARE